MAIEIFIGALAAAVSLGAGLYRTFLERKEMPRSITVTLHGKVNEPDGPIIVESVKGRDTFYDLQRSRLKRIQNGEKVTIWDESSEKAAAEALEYQRQRFDLLLRL